MIRLGVAPQQLEVTLTAGGRFDFGLRNRDTTWPLDAAIRLDFSNGTSWPALITGDTATWSQPALAVSALLAGGPLRAKLVYSAGGREVIWADGVVKKC